MEKRDASFAKNLAVIDRSSLTQTKKNSGPGMKPWGTSFQRQPKGRLADLK